MNKIVILLIFLSLSVNALSKAEIIDAAMKCCKSQLNVNRKDAIGLMLLHYLTTETTNNRDVLLLEAKMKRGLDIKADGKGDLLKLSKLYEQAAAAYIRVKNYKKAAYYLALSEKLNPLSDDALISQHLLQEKGFKVTNAQLLGPYGSGGLIPSSVVPQANIDIDIDTDKVIVRPSGRFNARKLPANTSTFKIDGHYYALILERATWKQAKVKAEMLGGYLACITGPGENGAILKFIKLQHIWIGATDEIKEGSFKWVNGEQFSYSYFKKGEPNNSGRQGEDALAFHRGEWNDVPAEKKTMGYLVEWNK